MERILSIICGTLLVLGLAFAAGLYSGATRAFPYDFVKEAKAAVSDYENILGLRPVHWTSPRRKEGDGVTIRRPGQTGDGYVMLQGFFEGGPEIRLIDLDGTLVNRWPLDPGALTEGVAHLRNRPAWDWNYDSHGAILLPDGAAVLNIDHVALAKLDRCGAPLWRVDRPAHHAVEADDDGALWAPSAVNHRDRSRLPTALYRPPFAEDSILKVSAEGEVLDEISLLDVFIQNDATGLLTLAGGGSTATYDGTRPDMEKEIFHLNDAEPLPAAMASAFPDFAAGDLLVSLRNRNLIFVMDPETRAIKWWRIGNWIRQHDPDWAPDGMIRIFDNNRDGTETGEILGSSRIVAISPSEPSGRVLLGGEGDPYFHTTRRGKHQQLPGGRMLITEAEAGRVFMTDAAGGVIWEYVNGFDADYTARISEARFYPRDYFTLSGWSCAASTS